MLYYTVKDPDNTIKAQFLVCGYENGLIQFIDDSLQGSYSKNFEIKAHRSRVIDLKICGDHRSDLSQFLVSFSYDNSILFIKLETLRIELTHIFEFREKGVLNCLDFYQDFLIFGCEDGYLRFFHFENNKLKFVCQKHYLSGAEDSATEFHPISTLKVFENLLLVADNFGGMAVLDLRRLVRLLNRFLELKTQRVNQIKNGRLKPPATENRKFGSGLKKKHLQIPELTFEDLGLDIHFDWQLIFIDQCHLQKIVKITDLNGQAILTSGKDCKTKVWKVERSGGTGPRGAQHREGER